jgi:Cu-Zn family superoxide dismutase
MRTIAALVFMGLLGACATSGNGSPSTAEPIAPRTVQIVAQDGRAIGRATFTEAPHGVLIRLEFSQAGLSPGWHGLHIHQKGDCSDVAAGFHNSAGHVGMGAHTRHGLLNPEGPEAGDLPNLFAAAAPPYGGEFFNPHVTLSSTAIGDRQPLLDADGSALIIHASPDDGTSQPIGNAGARVACAALSPLP